MEKEKKQISIDMKTAIICILVIVIIIGIICYFATNKKSSNENTSTVTAGTNEPSPIIENTTSENTSSVTTSQENTTNIQQNIENTQEVKKVKLNDKIKVKDFCEITIKSHKFAKTIEPPSPDSYYNYYSASNGDNTYFDLQLSIKNLQDMAVKQNSIADVTLIYNDKYKYDCFEVTEKDNGGDFQTFPSLYTIDPLKTLKYHFLVEVPKDVKNSKESLKAIIKANGEEFEYVIR